MNVSDTTQSVLYSTTSASQMLQQTKTSESSSYEELQSAAELISQDDTDSDGLLTINETPLSDDMFSTADEDGDGYLTEEELEAYLEVGAGASGALALSDMDAASILDSEDTDESGALSFEETTLTEEMFATADTDADGELSEDEIAEYISTAPGLQAGAMDATSIVDDDDDDESSVDETSTTEAIFSAIDTDGDGSISAEELEDYLASNEEGTNATDGPPPGGGAPPEEDDDDEEDDAEETSVNAANAFAISAYESVSANFMSIMTGAEDGETYTDTLFSNLMA